MQDRTGVYRIYRTGQECIFISLTITPGSQLDDQLDTHWLIFNLTFIVCSTYDKFKICRVNVKYFGGTIEICFYALLDF